VLWEVQNVEKSDKKWGSKNFDFVVNLNIGRTSFEPKNILLSRISQSSSVSEHTNLHPIHHSHRVTLLYAHIINQGISFGSFELCGGAVSSSFESHNKTSPPTTQAISAFHYGKIELSSKWKN
jgi:hypothetical protein